MMELCSSTCAYFTVAKKLLGGKVGEIFLSVRSSDSCRMSRAAYNLAMNNDNGAIEIYNAGASIPVRTIRCDRASRDGNGVVTFFKDLRIIDVVQLEPGQTTRAI